MPDSIWTSSLAAYRERLATIESVPAGVSTAAVCAAFALGLLIKVLAIASRRRDFTGDRALAAAWMDEAKNHADILANCADDDIIAFRQRSRDAIEVPLNVGRAAIAGLSLCDKAEPLVHAAIAPDLAAARTFITAAARAAFFSLEANLEQLPSGDRYREEVTRQVRELQQKLSAHGQNP